MARRDVADLLEIVSRLRDPDGGCPWDLAQSYATIVPHTIEEAHEVAEVIERGQWDELPDELGDLLFQVVFYAQIASEEERFDFTDVVDAIATKMIRRHPHVFSDVQYENLDEQSAAWERIKAREKAVEGDQLSGALQGVGQSLPALTRALKLQRKASRVGFDWSRPEPVLDKVEEELGELREALGAASCRQRLSHELGDLLFACVNAARHLEVDPEQALRAANRRFENRFQRIESMLRERGTTVSETDLKELDALWERAKKDIDAE